MPPSYYSVHCKHHWQVFLCIQDSRDSLGLHLKGSVVVVDEAHNLVDAVNSVHCAEVSAQQLTAAETQLSTYFERFRTRLAAGLLITTHPCQFVRRQNTVLQLGPATSYQNR